MFRQYFIVSSSLGFMVKCTVGGHTKLLQKSGNLKQGSSRLTYQRPGSREGGTISHPSDFIPPSLGTLKDTHQGSSLCPFGLSGHYKPLHICVCALTHRFYPFPLCISSSNFPEPRGQHHVWPAFFFFLKEPFWHICPPLVMLLWFWNSVWMLSIAAPAGSLSDFLTENTRVPGGLNREIWFVLPSSQGLSEHFQGFVNRVVV